MHARSRLAAVLVPVLVAGLAAAALMSFSGGRADAAGDDDPRTFDGWRVVQDGVEERFPETDGWKGVALRDGFQLTRLQETVTFYGCLRAERVERVAASPTSGAKEDRGDGWTIRQAGVERTYPRTEGWVGRPNPDGYYLERRGQTVWYYGTFRSVARPKDDSDLRGR